MVFTDIVMPYDNEKELVVMAKQLGVSSLLMLYPYGKVPQALPDMGMRVSVGCLAAPNDVEKAQRFGVVAVQSSEHDRPLFERGNAPRLLLGLGENQGDDRMHQRESGLNQPLLRELARRDSCMVISLNAILRTEGATRAQLLGRIMQNVALCRKTGVRMVLSSCASSPFDMRSPQDMQAIGIVLGMHPEEAKNALSHQF